MFCYQSRFKMLAIMLPLLMLPNLLQACQATAQTGSADVDGPYLGQPCESKLRGLPFFANHDRTVAMPAAWVTQDIIHEAVHRDADLVITLNQDTYPVLAEEIYRYGRENGLKIGIQSGTCGTSAGKLMQKTIDSGGFCCPPGDTDRLPGLEHHTIAITAVAVMVNGNNPQENLSLAEARDIFQGYTRNWRELGEHHPHDVPIEPTARLHCKARPGHWTLLLANQELFSPNLQEVGVIPDLVAKVAQERFAIGLETAFMVKENSKPGAVKLLNIDGHAPTDIAHLASGQYPAYRTFNMTTWRDHPRRDETLKLIYHMRDYIEAHHDKYHMAPVSMLKANGWQFVNDELVAEPSGQALAQFPPNGHHH
ncbi:MAG: hypothetical protein ACNA75_09315 [Thiohalomonadaceae bacterium]